MLDARTARTTSMPSMSGSPEVEDDRVRGWLSTTPSAGSCTAGRGQDLVATGAEVDGQGPDDLRLVVDHQHAGHDVDPATSERSRCPAPTEPWSLDDAQRHHHGEAAAGCVFGVNVPAHRLGEPAAEGEAEPDARRVVGVPRRWNGAKTASWASAGCLVPGR